MLQEHGSLPSGTHLALSTSSFRLTAPTQPVSFCAHAIRRQILVWVVWNAVRFSWLAALIGLSLIAIVAAALSAFLR